MSNPFKSVGIEFHILQSFPVTCLNRDDAGAPKNAIVGGVTRARVSSQCWKRQVRFALHELGIKTALRTKRVQGLLKQACLDQGATEEQAEVCSEAIAKYLSNDTLLFISDGDVARLAEYAKGKNFQLPDLKSEKTKIAKCMTSAKTAADGLDIALFGRMVAQDPAINVQAAASFAHAISTHQASSDVDFFTAIDDKAEGPESAHMGTLEFNSATYYRYICLDLGQLCENMGGEKMEMEDMEKAVSAFIQALYIAVPEARQTTQAGYCLWDYAKVLIREGQHMQVSFEKPVMSRGGYLQPSIERLNKELERREKLSGSLYKKLASFTFGEDENFNIDNLVDGVIEAVRKQGQSA